MKSSRVTIKMIAEKAGMSIGTVDRALNNRSGVNEQSKQHVLKVAEELGYRPNKFASALSRRSAIRLGFVYPDHPWAFYAEIESGIDCAAEELRDYGISVEKIRYNLDDPKATTETLQKLTTLGFDGVAINAAGYMDNADIDRIIRADIPVITFNTDAPDSGRLFFIGSNALESGRMGAELLSIMLCGSGDITVVGNFEKSMPFLERFNGFYEYIQNSDSCHQVLKCAENKSDPALVCERLKEMLKKYPDLNGVFCTGYSSTIGAINALKDLNRKDVYLLGYDITEETAEALREGWCDVLLYQEPYEQGYQAARLLARQILENWMPDRPRLHLDTRVVMRSNIDSYISRKENIWGRIS